MDFKQLKKDLIEFNFDSLLLRVKKLQALLLRRLVLLGKKIEPSEIPVIINNRNRLTTLKQLIEWLEKIGMKNIYIIDNDSTYPPLLNYYKSCPHKVFLLNQNVGHLALWKTDIFNQFKSNYYIYTDSDVLPIEECPNDVIAYFLNTLTKYSAIEKIGFGLKIDDLPDHYAAKAKVIDWENKFWKKEVAPGIFDAAIDTTFALYCPYTNGAQWVSNAYRTGGKYIARHLPWYENTSAPTPEDQYYQEHVKQGVSHWIQNTENANEK